MMSLQIKKRETAAKVGQLGARCSLEAWSVSEPVAHEGLPAEVSCRQPVTINPLAGINPAFSLSSSHAATLLSKSETVGRFKPTLLYLYEMIGASQALAAPKHLKKPWWVRIPSGRWRVLWGYAMLSLATIDVFRCGTSIAFCQSPYFATDMWAVQSIFLLDVLIKLITAVPDGAACYIEVRPLQIFRHYMTTSMLPDLVGLVPLELWTTACWTDQPDAAACFQRAGALRPFLSYQWLHLLRWFTYWRRSDCFRSVTHTRSDMYLAGLKLGFLVFVLGHIACCLLYWASLGREYNPVCDYKNLHTLSWTQVSTVLRKHNSLDPFNQLLSDTSASGDRGLVVPTNNASAAAEGFVELYAFWYFAALSALLGDPFGAKNTYSRVLCVFLLLAGNVLFAMVFGEVVLHLQRSSAQRDAYAARMSAINHTMTNLKIPTTFQRR